MTKKRKHEYKDRNPVAKELLEGRTGAFKLRAVHPKKYDKPKRLTPADVRRLSEEEE